MNTETLLALAAFALVSSITPGPNNLMLMASGTNFGFRRTLPHMTGVTLGFMLMLLIVGAGLMQLFTAYPVSFQILRVVSVAYLIYLAWKIANAAPVGGAGAHASVKPFSFIQAAAFQWVNPKAWIMALTATSVYTTDQQFDQVVVIAIVFGVVNLPCVSSWVAVGQQLRRLLSSRFRLRVFNIAMAVLLIASLLPSLLSGRP